MSHGLTWSQFAEFCAGPVDHTIVSSLRDGQYSRRRLLLSAIVDAAPELDDAWRILVAADERDPAAVEHVLMSPLVGVWLAQAVRLLHGAATDGPVELGFLRSLAAAAAIRARVPCELQLPVVAGVVTLPTVGQFDLREFVPVHRHRGVEIDDRTPYREFSAPVPPHPLRTAELQAWRQRIDAASDVLTHWHPRSAKELAAGLSVLVPITPPSRVVGSSAPAAFGAVRVSPHDSPTVLAETLVHELQHSKLNALLDLVVMHTRDPAALVYAPWRDDPRPLTGLLHGIYAFTATAEFWSVQRKWVPRPDRPLTTFTFVRRLTQVRRAIDDLATALDLTQAGTGLVEAATLRLARCPADDVPARVLRAAATTITDHHARWRLRHLRPAASSVADAVAAWHAGAPLPAPDPSTLAPNRGEDTPPRRIGLLTRIHTDPGGFTTDGTPDAAFAEGAYETALDAYTRHLRDTPADGDAWIGLGLTLRALGDDVPVLVERPEIAVAVRARLPADVPPLEFARWLRVIRPPTRAGELADEDWAF
jgi:hypothetical protein